MRKIKLIPAVAIIALFVSFLSSCTSKSGHKMEEKARKAEQAKHIADSIENAKPSTYAFHPTQVEVSRVEKIDDGMIPWGKDGKRVMGSLFRVEAFFFDSTGRQHACSFFGSYAKNLSEYSEGGEQELEINWFNKNLWAYQQVIMAENKELIVTCDKLGTIVKIEKVNKKTNNGEKVGNAFLRENDPIETLYITN